MLTPVCLQVEASRTGGSCVNTCLSECGGLQDRGGAVLTPVCLQVEAMQKSGEMLRAFLLQEIEDLKEASALGIGAMQEELHKHQEDIRQAQEEHLEARGAGPGGRALRGGAPEGGGWGEGSEGRGLEGVV